MFTLTLYGQDYLNPVENLKAYKYELNGVDYVMFEAEDYRELLSIGRKKAILEQVYDTLQVQYRQVDSLVTYYIIQVDELQELSESLQLEIVDLKKSFKEYTARTEKRIAGLLKRNRWMRNALIGTTAVIILETIMILTLTR